MSAPIPELASVVTDAVGRQAVGARFDRLEAEMREFPQVEIPPVHHFAPGVYAREITIPAGTILTGKIHRHGHLNIISQGEISVWSEKEGVRRITAPFSFVAPAGTRRIGYAHTDVTWTTIHANPDDARDLEQIEAALIEPRDNLTGGNLSCHGSQLQ